MIYRFRSLSKDIIGIVTDHNWFVRLTLYQEPSKRNGATRKQKQKKERAKKGAHVPCIIHLAEKKNSTKENSWLQTSFIRVCGLQCQHRASQPTWLLGVLRITRWVSPLGVDFRRAFDLVGECLHAVAFFNCNMSVVKWLYLADVLFIVRTVWTLSW